MPATHEEIKSLISVVRGDKKPTLLLKNVRLVNVFNGEILETNVAIYQKYIAGIGDYSEAHDILDLKGRFLLPGLIDAHLHLESSFLTPSSLASALISHGTTSIIIDPHEIANVLGIKGVEYILKASEAIPLNVFMLVPSCVPATHLETAGGKIGIREIRRLLKHPRVIGLAEMMNYPGVITANDNVLKKITCVGAQGLPIDGHAPMLSGKALQTYIAAGIDSDHETTTLTEAKEKLSLGMWLMLREGSAAKNLLDLLPAVNEYTVNRCLLCCDDKEAQDLIDKGHMDFVIKKTIQSGLKPLWAIKMATINTAQRFGLKGIGAIAPGYLADMVVVDSLEEFNVVFTIKSGETVFENGMVKGSIPSFVPPEVTHTVHLPKLKPDHFKIWTKGNKAHVIGLIPNQIVNKDLICEVKKHGDEVISDTDNDILKVAVVERHKGTGNIGLGLISGLGLKFGAIAQSIAHDSHNIIVVGTHDKDIHFALSTIHKMQGGIALVNDGKLIAALELPIAGLISQLSVSQVAFKTQQLIKESQNLGVKLSNPFLSLSFIALPVIPTLRLTDKGLVDVSQFRFVPLEAK
ncbi:adenine deaminase [Desulfothermus okinawensis]